MTKGAKRLLNHASEDLGKNVRVLDRVGRIVDRQLDLARFAL